MSKIKLIMDKLTSISNVDKQTLFYNNVEQKLDLHLARYYERLQKQVDKLYDKILNKDIILSMRSINSQLNKNRRTK